ncbi:fumarate hydratase [Mucilaginibacter flavidus]|uniref:fumarate hydratase n=1 Tax=Mucilaginibacter flavidus TaxID=2949309 RepID=UPI0020920B65|nr:fumarate hydratase [Mucilaginibacter flavidus]MCO5948843.1 fumarate hydratase [Mucilaginibacter flavidus]
MQKPFAFYLLPLALLMALGSACTFNPDKQKPGQSWVQGEWRQDSVPAQKRLVSYSLYDLKFSCDSFFVTIHSFSKVSTGADTCTGSGKWIEYWKGTYEQRHDTLRMKGEFCKADKSVKDETTCLRFGDYEEYFKITKTTDSLVQFASITNVIPINARLIKRTSCVPKPL